MNNVAGEILAILRRYLSDPTSRSLLSSAARRANVRLETMSRADVSALVRELGPGLNIFLQEPEKLQNCKKQLALVATENSASTDSPMPRGNNGNEGTEISDPTLILSGAYRSKWGTGAGLRGTKRLIDEFKLETHPGPTRHQVILNRHPESIPTGTRLFISSETFPPHSLWPILTPADLQWLKREACGAPGSLVWPGLFPHLHQKLARLLLASAGHYDPRIVLSAARDAYAPDRGAFLPQKPRETRRCHAHDAFACALVHPGISIDERHALALETIAPSSRGQRSRRKTWAILRFAFSNGFLAADRLPQEVVERLSPAHGLDPTSSHVRQN